VISKEEFEKWNKRANKNINKQIKQRAEEQKIMKRKSLKADFFIFMIIATPILLLIWNGFSQQITTIKSCNAISTKKMMANYSERDSDFEMD
jgi:hypothetical protein